MVREKAERWSSVNVKRIKTADNASYMPGCSSLTYDSSAVVYFPMDVNVTITSFVENQEWTVVEFKMFREQVQQCCGQPISLIQARLTLKRKPLYYVINLIVPAFIVTIISFVGFFTPDNSYGERKDKVNLGISTLLAMSVLLMSLSDTMPTTSKYLPVMGMFYLCIIVLISLATLMASLVLKLDQKSRTGPIPHLFRTMFFKRLSSLVFANIPSYHQNKVCFYDHFINVRTTNSNTFGLSTCRRAQQEAKVLDLQCGLLDHGWALPH
uniref:Neurotransmitter-gated ion-channel transmembrane domain-containing protein n=1 Tax=Romanomermis culicivorax TaxID=13658 RepID=A0A915HKK3_ROMCU